MIGPAMDRGGLKDSENAPNSVFSKINESPFWRFGTDMIMNREFEPNAMQINNSNPSHYGKMLNQVTRWWYWK